MNRYLRIVCLAEFSSNEHRTSIKAVYYSGLLIHGALTQSSIRRHRGVLNGTKLIVSFHILILNHACNTIYYPALVLFEQAYCIYRINICYIPSLTEINSVFILQKNHINPLTFILWIKQKHYIIIPWLPLLIFQQAPLSQG
jgi:hypothetical protein